MGRTRTRLVTRYLQVALLLLAVWSLTPARVPAATESLLWQGQSAGYTVRWTTQDLTASHTQAPNRPVFSEKALTQAYLSNWTHDRTSDDFCDYSNDITLLSLVGPYLSFEKSEYTDCKGAAHPQVLTTYEVVNLNRPDTPVSLMDLFPDAQVLGALLADPVIKAALWKIPGPLKHPQTTAALVKLLSDQPGDEAECEYIFEPDMLQHFAFHHLEGGKVAVRIGLSYGQEACRGVITQLGLLLPLPARLKPALLQADTRQAGLLMKDHKAIPGEKFCRISL